MGPPDNGVSVVTDSLYVDTVKLKYCVLLLREVLSGVDETAKQIADIRKRLNYKAASRLAVEAKLRRQENRLIMLAEQIGSYADALDTVGNLYNACENRLCGEIAETMPG